MLNVFCDGFFWYLICVYASSLQMGRMMMIVFFQHVSFVSLELCIDDMR